MRTHSPGRPSASASSLASVAVALFAVSPRRRSQRANAAQTPAKKHAAKSPPTARRKKPAAAAAASGSRSAGKATRAAFPRASRQCRTRPRTRRSPRLQRETRRMKSALAPRSRSATTISRGTSRIWRSAGCAKPSTKNCCANMCSTGRRRLRWRWGRKKRRSSSLQSFRRDFPDSVMTEQAVDLSGADGAGDRQRRRRPGGARCLSEYDAKPALLLLRAQAREKIAAAKGEKPAAAAADYLDLYYRFPLNDEAKAAGQKIPVAAIRARRGFSRHADANADRARGGVLRRQALARGAARNSQACFRSCRASDHERADLRIAQCEVELGGKLGAAERDFADRSGTRRRAHFFDFAGASRSQKLESQMLDDVDQLVKRFPQSTWTADGAVRAQAIIIG